MRSPGSTSPAAATTAYFRRWWTQYDPEDWQLEKAEFQRWEGQFGPHTLDAAADDLGTNAMCKRYCSRAQPWQTTRLKANDNVWCNPPFRRAGSWLRRYWQQKVLNPQLSGTFVLPYKPDAKWWYLTRGLTKIHT